MKSAVIKIAIIGFAIVACILIIPIIQFTKKRNVIANMDTTEVLLGKEDWLFYKTGKNIEDYQGIEPISESDIKYIAEVLEKAKQYFNNRGIEFFVLIGPNKEEIYSEYLPDNIQVINNDNRVDKILDYVQSETNVDIIYPIQALLDNKQYQLYKKYDTHWNKLGAFVATQECLQYLGEPIEVLDEITIKDGNKISGDLAVMSGTEQYLDDDIDYEISGYHDEIIVSKISEIPQDYLNYQRYESSVENEKSILILGDSLVNDMMPFFAKNYKYSACVHINNYTEDILNQTRPDIIIYEQVERSAIAMGVAMDQVLE